jgi:tRNA isopentenyl-2-thiomethyl-A-37 hydroxylase MiaE
MSQPTPIAQLEDAQKGFDLIFIDNIEGAKEACQFAIQLYRRFHLDTI